jgi:hypothetical protein
MVAELDRVDGGLSPAGRRSRSAAGAGAGGGGTGGGGAGEAATPRRSRSGAATERTLPMPPDDGDVLDVPEFIPPN